MEIIKEQYFLFNTNKTKISYILENKIMIYTNISKINFEEINIEIDLNEIIWKYDENNLRIPYLNENKLRIPYLNENKILYYKLKQNDNIIDFISSCSFINDYDIINGEKIQNCADIVIGHQSSLCWNPNNNKYSKLIHDIDTLSNINNYKSIFVFTHDLNIFYDKFKLHTENKIIITHNSDCEIKEQYNFKLHLSQNTFITNNNIIPIPIGIENTQWFDNNLFHYIRKNKILKTKFIYFYFNQNTHPSRKECYNKLINKLEWNTSKSKIEYFIEIASHKYAICPRGNGLDTHRIWECLYLNTIPIVVKSDFPNIINLPIIILNSWSELDINNIDNIFIDQKISKITTTYYSNIINQLY